MPTLSSLYQEDPRLPNTGADYSRIGGPRRYKWSPEEKQILYVLSRYYKNEAVEVWKVFLSFFAETYRHSVRPRKSAWNTMRQWNMNPVRYSVWWGATTTTRIKAQLEREALKIGVRLQLVLKGDLKARHSKKRRSSRSSSITSEGDGVWYSKDTEDTDYASVRGQIVKKNPRTLQTPRSGFIKSAGGLPTAPSSQRVPRKVAPAWIARPSIPPIAFRGKRCNLYQVQPLLTSTKHSVRTARD